MLSVTVYVVRAFKQEGIELAENGRIKRNAIKIFIVN
jgi:hypothetical protein